MHWLTRTLTLALFLVAATATLAEKPAMPPPVDLSTPEASVRSFVAALNRVDMTSAGKCVVERGTPAELAELEKMFGDPRQKLFFKIEEPATQLNGETAKVTLRVVAVPHSDQRETIELRRVEKEWKIVPPPLALALEQKSPILSTLSLMISRPEEVLKTLREGARRASCQSNLKQIASAVAQFVQDNDDVLALPPDGAHAAILPYLRDERVFRCPSVAADGHAYSFNAALEGAAVSNIPAPAETVLFYEGKDGKLDFRHGGSANVAFIDGHVKAVSAAEAKTLRWEP